jgi:hypothetical protein
MAKQKYEARRKAFRRSMQDAVARSLIAVREVNGVQLVWLVDGSMGNAS